MFTGLVQAVGLVQSVEPRGLTLRLCIEASGWAHAPALGDSICVSGVCLTVAQSPAPGQPLAFDVVHETLSKTTLGRLTPGRRVNLEHAVTASTLMGGHFVQGHVDGVGNVTHVQRSDDWRLTIEPPPALMDAMIPRGSVCVEGVSLTLAEVTSRTITLALIPTTLEKTTLGALQPGDRVNIEADMLVKSVVAVVANLRAARQ